MSSIQPPAWNLFTAAKNRLASHHDTDAETLDRLSKTGTESVQQRIAENSSSTPDTLEYLSKHASGNIRAAVAQNGSTASDVIGVLARDGDADVRYAMAENAATDAQLLWRLANDENPYVSERALRTLARLKAEKDHDNRPALAKKRGNIIASRFSRFYLKLFVRGPRSSSSEQRRQPTLANLAALPERTRLMVGHFLDYKTPDLMILTGDADLPDLLATGWVEHSSPPSPPGVACLHFTDAAWHRLLDLRRRLLSAPMHIQLTKYRALKTAEYPWVW